MVVVLIWRYSSTSRGVISRGEWNALVLVVVVIYRVSSFAVGSSTSAWQLFFSEHQQARVLPRNARRTSATVIFSGRPG